MFSYHCISQFCNEEDALVCAIHAYTGNCNDQRYPVDIFDCPILIFIGTLLVSTLTSKDGVKVWPVLSNNFQPAIWQIISGRKKQT